MCSPTRAALLTGRCWSRFNVTTPTNNLALPWETVTLPGALKQVGYETCLTGKWHLGSLPEQGPQRFGFDHSYGSLAGGVSPWNHRYKQGPFSVTWHRNCELLEETGHVTQLIRDEAIKWLRERDRQTPFFLYVPFTAVHLPVKEPAEWVARVPESITGEVPRHYAACILQLDDAVGKIVATLDELKLRENTLLVFTSDNGGSTAENNDLKYPDDNCPNGRLPGNNRPFRGQKGDVYEGGIRVPTIVSWPGKIAPGPNPTPVQITDWMPTFCQLAGATETASLNWDGRDLSALLVQRESLPDRPIYTVGPNWRARALRYGDWKLIAFSQGPTSQNSTERFELYDLAEDPGESTDLAKTELARLQEMQSLLNQASRDDRDAVARP